MSWVKLLPTLPLHCHRPKRPQFPWMSGLNKIIVFGCKLSSLYQKFAQILMLLSEAENDESNAKEIWYIFVLLDDVIKSDCQELFDENRFNESLFERGRKARGLYGFKVENLIKATISTLYESDTLDNALEKIKSNFDPKVIQDLETHPVVVASRSV